MSHLKLFRLTLAGLAALVATAVLAVPVASAAGTVAGPGQTTITLKSSKPVANYGDSGKITATVKAVAPAKGIPTGTVDFNIDGSWFWTADLNALGKATLSLADIYPSSSPGTYSITATYNGDSAFDPSTTASAISQTLVGITEAPVSTVTTGAGGKPVFSPSSFRMSSLNPVGCNVTIANHTDSSLALLYGTPGNWKRLPSRGGIIAPGANGGVGVSLDHFTGYFTAVGAKNYVAIHCV
ncbi:MAG: Ig-like domain-containing protein [Solirubrobacterales bacterium]